MRKRGDIKKKLCTIFILLVGCLVSRCAFAQDERVLRYILRNKVLKEQSLIDRTKWRISSKFYELDLDGDKRNEKISMENNDGINYFVVRNYRNFAFFREPFLTQAIGGIVHRVRLVQISKNTKALIVYYFEGKTEYIDFQATGRLYFVSWKNDDLSTMKMSRGPHYWQEFKSYRGNYFTRKFEVFLKDYNKDGVKEVAVKHGTISRVYHLLRDNSWGTLPPE